MSGRKKAEPNSVEYVAVATVEELPNGTRKFLEVDGEPIAVFNIADTYYAIADLCSHDGGPVAEGNVYGHEIECPRHGARFDVRTGKVVSFPAVVDIPVYPVKVEGGQVLVGFPAAT
jgi:3-phenylpropionate/trans-cinnamate dioxygenase ferredoxin component